MIEIDIEQLNNQILDMRDEDYFALDRVSASTLKRLLNGEEYEIANKIPTEKTDAMILGSLIHCMVLEPDEVDKRYAVMPKVDLRTSIGKETKIVFERNNQGKEIIKDEMLETAKECYKSLVETGTIDLFKGGETEQAILFNILGVEAKGKLDYYNESKGLLVDLKTTQKSGLDFAKECADRDYFLQGSFYYDGLQTLGKKVNQVLFVGIQTKSPFKVTIVRQNMPEIEHGRICYGVALEIWKAIKNNPERYKSRLSVNPESGGDVFDMQIPTYKLYDLDRLKKQLNGE